MSDSIVTLTTDFGVRDSYVAQMKGVILSIAPKAGIVDVTHDVPPQDLTTAAGILAAIVPVYPPGTIHACVVDPGVGGSRSFLLVRTKNQILVLPDNGLISSLIPDSEDRDLASDFEVREMTETWYRREPFSATFHGRDLVAPAVGHLARGVPPDKFGPLLARPPVILNLPRLELLPNGVRGVVTAIDRFGNLLTNLTADSWNGIRPENLLLIIGDRKISPLRNYYSEIGEGEFIILLSSFGTLEVACRNGNAAKSLNGTRGMKVELRFQTGSYEP